MNPVLPCIQAEAGAPTQETLGAGKSISTAVNAAPFSQVLAKEQGKPSLAQQEAPAKNETQDSADPVVSNTDTNTNSSAAISQAAAQKVAVPVAQEATPQQPERKNIAKKGQDAPDSLVPTAPFLPILPAQVLPAGEALPKLHGAAPMTNGLTSSSGQEEGDTREPFSFLLGSSENEKASSLLESVKGASSQSADGVWKKAVAEIADKIVTPQEFSSMAAKIGANSPLLSDLGRGGVSNGNSIPGWTSTLLQASPSKSLDSTIGLDANALPLSSSPLLLPLANHPEQQLPQAQLGPAVQDQGRWSAALGQGVQWMLQGGIQQAVLHLHPEHLGPLEVHLNVGQDGQATALFVSSHPEVRAAIQAAVPQLQQSFAAAGLSLGQASVDAGGAGTQGNYFTTPPRPAPFSAIVPPQELERPPILGIPQLGLVNTFV